MEASRFDAFVRSLAATPSRRGVLRGLAAAALGGPAMRLPEAADARGKKKKKLKRNEFGCVNVGGKCRGKDANCCSGICDGKKPKKGKKDKSRCVAHDEGDCQPGENKCIGPEIACSRGGDDTDARFCFTTTGNGEYCSSGTDFGSASCSKDAECVGDCGVGAACVKCEQGGVVTGRCVGLDVSCGVG